MVVQKCIWIAKGASFSLPRLPLSRLGKLDRRGLFWWISAVEQHISKWSFIVVWSICKIRNCFSPTDLIDPQQAQITGILLNACTFVPSGILVNNSNGICCFMWAIPLLALFKTEVLKKQSRWSSPQNSGTITSKDCFMLLFTYWNSHRDTIECHTALHFGRSRNGMLCRLHPQNAVHTRVIDGRLEWRVGLDVQIKHKRTPLLVCWNMWDQLGI